jgi:uncharacterized low-complexity protein
VRLASRPGPGAGPWGWLVTRQVASDDLDLGPSTVANALDGPTSVATGRHTCHGTLCLITRRAGEGSAGLSGARRSSSAGGVDLGRGILVGTIGAKGRDPVEIAGGRGWFLCQ